MPVMDVKNMIITRGIYSFYATNMVKGVDKINALEVIQFFAKIKKV